MTAADRPAAARPGPDRLVVALVRGIHGLKGGVRVEVLTDRPEDRYLVGAVLHREGDARPLTIVEAGPDSPGWLLRFREIPDRNAAETLRERYLEADLGPDEAPGEGEFYWHEVIGTPVRDRRGNDLGQVVEVYRAGGVDAYVIRGGTVEEFDLPAVREFIPVFRPGEEIVVDADRLELEPARPKRIRPPRPRKGDVARARAAAAAPAATAGPAPDEMATSDSATSEDEASESEPEGDPA